MHYNSASDKWIVVLNNPDKQGMNHQKIISQLQKFELTYYCMADEVSETGTFHTHVFFAVRSNTRFGTVKNRFPSAHIEHAYGSEQQNRDYIQKIGIWADTSKASTIVPGSFEEWGTYSIDQKSTKDEATAQMIADLRNGMSTLEVISRNPKLALKSRDIEALRQLVLSEKYATEYRDITVSYLYGATGTGKTKSIFDAHDARNICRITNYRIGKGISFDSYTGQNVLVLEEFHGQLPIGDMLNILDRYPIQLPARYSDRTAAFTYVYLTSNVPLNMLYRDIQRDYPEVWQAFLRRIHNVVEFMEDGAQIVVKGDKYAH